MPFTADAIQSTRTRLHYTRYSSTRIPLPVCQYERCTTTKNSGNGGGGSTTPELKKRKCTEENTRTNLTANAGWRGSLSLTIRALTLEKYFSVPFSYGHGSVKTLLGPRSRLGANYLEFDRFVPKTGLRF